MYRTLCLLLFLVIWLVPSAPVLANPLCLKSPIRFAHHEFGLLHSEGYGGIDDDIQEELAKRSGCAFEVSVKPHARIWNELKSGAVDMAGSGVASDERNGFAWFAFYVVERNQMMLGPNVPASVKSMDQFLAMPALTIGGIRSFRYGAVLDKYVDELVYRNRFYQTPSPSTLYRMFERSRFDAFIASQFLSLHYFNVLRLPRPHRVAEWDLDSQAPSGLVMSKARFSSAQAAGWQSLIRQMLADGSVERIVRKHMGEGFDPGSIYKAP